MQLQPDSWPCTVVAGSQDALLPPHPHGPLGAAEGVEAVWGLVTWFSACGCGGLGGTLV